MRKNVPICDLRASQAGGRPFARLPGGPRRADGGEGGVLHQRNAGGAAAPSHLQGGTSGPEGENHRSSRVQKWNLFIST